MRLATCLIAVLVVSAAVARADESPLPVAISLDLPPYVIAKATSGLEVDILRSTLPDRRIDFVQMPYADLETAVPRGRADVTVAVQKFSDDGVFYSNDFVTFENAAITKKSAHVAIDSIAALAGHPVMAWQDAYRELGPEFEKLFAPDAPARQSYVEIGDQREQVRRFWEAEAAVIVIDRNIFAYFSRELGHSVDDVLFHLLFPPVTNFKVGFRDLALRDSFNQRLAQLCEDGGYAKILARYHVELERTICEH